MHSPAKQWMALCISEKPSEPRCWRHSFVNQPKQCASSAQLHSCPSQLILWTGGTKESALLSAFWSLSQRKQSACISHHDIISHQSTCRRWSRHAGGVGGGGFLTLFFHETIEEKERQAGGQASEGKHTNRKYPWWSLQVVQEHTPASFFLLTLPCQTDRGSLCSKRQSVAPSQGSPPRKESRALWELIVTWAQCVCSQIGFERRKRAGEEKNLIDSDLDKTSIQEN